jgi:hypothetical protein
MLIALDLTLASSIKSGIVSTTTQANTLTSDVLGFE